MLKEQEFRQYIAVALLLVMSGMSGVFEFGRSALLLPIMLSLEVRQSIAVALLLT